MKARKKPVVIEAYQMFIDQTKNKENSPRWLDAAFKTGEIQTYGKSDKVVGYIRTLEGEMEIRDGDYIIKGVNEEIYPCKPDIFGKTYEIVGE